MDRENLQVATTIAEPKFKLIMEISVDLNSVITVGDIGKGVLRWVPITGGAFEGPGHDGATLKGIVLPYGQDLQLVKANGEWELDATYMLKTNEDEIVLINNKANRFGKKEDLQNLMEGKPFNPENISNAGVTVFEVSSPRLRWMKHHTFFPVGRRSVKGIRMQIIMVC
jgi:hypothetical protein